MTHIVCQPHDWQHRVFDSDLLPRLYFVSLSDLLLNTHASKSTVTSWPFTDIQTEVRKKRWVVIFSASAKYDFICEVRWNIDAHENNLEFPTVQRQP